MFARYVREHMEEAELNEHYGVSPSSNSELETLAPGSTAQIIRKTPEQRESVDAYAQSTQRHSIRWVDPRHLQASDLAETQF